MAERSSADEHHAGGFLGELRFELGDLLDSDAPWENDVVYDVVLLMPGRLVEAGRGGSNMLLARLAAQCKLLIVYAYGDWRRRFGSMAELVRRAGLNVVQIKERDGLGIATSGNAGRDGAPRERRASEEVETSGA